MGGTGLHVKRQAATKPIREPADQPLTERGLCDLYRSNLEFLQRAVIETGPRPIDGAAARLLHAAHDLETCLDAPAATARLTERLFADIAAGVPGRKYGVPVDYVSERLRNVRRREAALLPEAVAQTIDLCVIYYRRRTGDLVKALADYHRQRIDNADEILDGLAVSVPAANPACEGLAHHHHKAE